MVAFPKSKQQIVWQIRRDIKVVTVLLVKNLTIIFILTLNIPSNGHLVTDKLLVPKVSVNQRFHCRYMYAVDITHLITVSHDGTILY